MGVYQFSEAERALIERACIPLAIYQFIDKRVVTVALSDGFLELFAYKTREEALYLMDHDMYRDAHPDDVARVADAARAFAVEEAPYDIVYRTKRGADYIIVHSHGKHVFTDTGERLAVVWYDDEGTYAPEAKSFASRLSRLFNRSLHEESLNQTNYYDRMTGLPNMNYFFELAEAGRQTMANAGEQMAILFFDLSGMKYYNSKYGFAEGDKLIKSVARLLVKHYSNENCSHFGQDHFVVFTKADGLEEQLRQVLSEAELANDGNSLPLRVGIYLDQMDGVDISIACDRAKAACDLNSKKYFSDFMYFSPDMLTSAEHRQHILRSFDRALAEGWIEVYYQPIVRAANGRVCDEEALARWIEPDLGMLSPADFIPILEDAKLIYKLDLYVLERSLQKMKNFAQRGLYVVPTSINLSRADFEMCDIVEEVRRRVDDAGIPREKITVEITESIVGKDLEFMKGEVERFQELGFSVWMDDFGSGYSSLDVLQSIHFDLIKFDMMFMRQFDEGDKSKIILTELVKLAIALGVETIAEGVERKDQADFLREIGCNKLQGYYYTKPNSEAEVLKRYETGTAIGFENPEESAYYTAVGGVNLYDMSIITHEDRETFGQFFDTIPLAILELKGDDLHVSRSNRAYRELMAKNFDVELSGERENLGKPLEPAAQEFLVAAQQCAADGNRALVEGETMAGGSLHSILKRVAINPVTGVVAIAVAIIITEELRR